MLRFFFSGATLPLLARVSARNFSAPAPMPRALSYDIMLLHRLLSIIAFIFSSFLTSPMSKHRFLLPVSLRLPAIAARSLECHASRRYHKSCLFCAFFVFLLRKLFDARVTELRRFSAFSER